MNTNQLIRCWCSQGFVLLMGLILFSQCSKSSTDVNPASLSGTSWTFSSKDGSANVAVVTQVGTQTATLGATDVLNYERIDFTSQTEATLVDGTTKDVVTYTSTNGELAMIQAGTTVYMGIQLSGNNMTLLLDQPRLAKTFAANTQTATITVKSSTITFKLTKR